MAALLTLLKVSTIASNTYAQYLMLRIIDSIVSQ